MRSVFIFDGTYQCRTRRSFTCDWEAQGKKVEKLAKRWWRQDTWHFGVSGLMERSLEGAGFSRVENDEGESRRLLEGSSWGSGFCIVSMVTPPDVLSNYHLVLLHATSSCRHSEILRPHDDSSMVPRNSWRNGRQCNRIYKATVTSANFSNNRWGPIMALLVLHTLVSTYLHCCVPRRIAMKHI